MTLRPSKPRFRNRITRLGFHFLFVALFAIIGGSLRGFNLLLILAGLLVGVVFVQWRVGRANIRNARLKRMDVTGVHAGSTLTIRYQVENLSRWMPLWMIGVKDCVTPLRHGVIPNRGDNLMDDPPAELRSSVGSVATAQVASTAVQCRFHQRGYYEVGPAHVTSSFPFSLMQSDQLPAMTRQRLHVYPRLLTMRKGWQTMLPPRRGGDGNRSTGGTNHDGEFFGLRPWQSGDQIKHIHWRTTARIGAPAVRQFEQRNRHQVCLVVDGHDVPDRNDFELSLQFAASLIKELSSQTQSVALIVIDQLPDRAIYQSQAADISGLMQRLAIASPAIHGDTPPKDDGFEDALEHAASESGGQFQRYDVIVISSRSMREKVGTPPSATATSLVRQLNLRGHLSWINVQSYAARYYAGFNVTSKQISDQPKDSSNAFG